MSQNPIPSRRLRHTYWSVNSRGTPYHFRFSVSSDVFRDPSVFGRPAGVFNCDCWGYTLQDPSETRTKVKLSEDPNTKERFPLATAFTSREEAAVECDFWKLVLRHKYFLAIPWSHGTQEAFFEAAQSAQRDVLAELNDEKRWSHELLDFINEHHSLLHKHRDAHKPELDLDEWERSARKLPSRALFAWVQQVRGAQHELETLPDVSRLQALVNSLSSLRKYRPFECAKGSEFRDGFDAVNAGLISLSAFADRCEQVISAEEDKRRELKSALAALIKNRPPAIPDTDSGEEMHYQSNVT